MLWVSPQALMTHTCLVGIPDVPYHPQGSVQSYPAPSTSFLACTLALTSHLPFHGFFCLLPPSAKSTLPSPSGAPLPLHTGASSFPALFLGAACLWGSCVGCTHHSFPHKSKTSLGSKLVDHPCTREAAHLPEPQAVEYTGDTWDSARTPPSPDSTGMPQTHNKWAVYISPQCQESAGENDLAWACSPR